MEDSNEETADPEAEVAAAIRAKSRCISSCIVLPLCSHDSEQLHMSHDEWILLLYRKREDTVRPISPIRQEEMCTCYALDRRSAPSKKLL